MAEALLNTVLGKLAEEGTPAYEVLETYVGKDLEYKEYEHCTSVQLTVQRNSIKKHFM